MKKIKKIELCEYKGQKFEVEQEYYFDDFLNEYYCDVFLGNENLKKIRNKYREINDLLTDDQIKDIRTKYNLSQRDFALALGFGEITITRYESKTVQDRAQDNILKECKDPNYFLSMLVQNEEKFVKVNGFDKYIQLKKYISELKKNINYKINRYNLIDRGNKIFDLEKLKSVIHQIVLRKKDVTKTSLAKYLWYIDCLSFFRNKESMTGLPYISMQYGAYPKYYEEILSDENIITEQSWKKDYECLFIKDAYSTFELSEEEKRMIYFIVDKLKNYNAQSLVSFMHEERAYKETNMFDIISYNYSFDIKIFKEYV